MAIAIHRMRRLENPIQNYAWGSKTAIADLTGRRVPSSKPEAELWMGAHPKAPSQVVCNGNTMTLNDLIARYPNEILGERVARRFGNQLPFLFKVLAATEPLSIQAHPNQDQARSGYARENRAGIPLDASQRNYRDDNHKPEIICALTEFWGLNGFRTVEDLLQRLESYCPDSLAIFVATLHGRSPENVLRQLFRHMLSLQGREKNQAIAEVIEQAQTTAPDEPLSRWLLKLSAAYPGDIGILSPLILNLVRLAPGQAMYLPAGRLHAYLEGVGIELMANSDNVLRGGLTPKHVDQDELMSVLQFESRDPGVMTAQTISPTESRFMTSADEFCLTKLTVAPGVNHEASADHNVEILLLISGQAAFETISTGEQLHVSRGESVLIPAAAGSYRISGQAEIYKATVPETI